MVKKIIIELKNGEEQLPTLLQQLQKEIREKFGVHLSEPNTRNQLHGYVMTSGKKLILGIFQKEEDGKTELTNEGVLITKKNPGKLPLMAEAMQFIADALVRATADKSEMDGKRNQLRILRQRIRNEDGTLGTADLVRLQKLLGDVEK